MYKELDKYKEGFTVRLGTLLKEFITHINKPWWRRKDSDARITNEYISVFNNISIQKIVPEDSNEIVCPVCFGEGYLVSTHEGEIIHTKCIRCEGKGSIEND